MFVPLNKAVMLSEAKHLGLFSAAMQKYTEILRFAQNDTTKKIQK
jgi:hypothetical protein